MLVERLDLTCCAVLRGVVVYMRLGGRDETVSTQVVDFREIHALSSVFLLFYAVRWG